MSPSAPTLIIPPFFCFLRFYGASVEQPWTFSFHEVLVLIQVEVPRIALLWMLLWLCCHHSEFWSAMGDIHCMKTKWLKDSNNFLVQKFGRSFPKLLFFLCWWWLCISQSHTEVEIPKCSWKSFTCGLWTSHKHKVLETLWEHFTRQLGNV